LKIFDLDGSVPHHKACNHLWNVVSRNRSTIIDEMISILTDPFRNEILPGDQVYLAIQGVWKGGVFVGMIWNAEIYRTFYFFSRTSVLGEMTVFHISI